MAKRIPKEIHEYIRLHSTEGDIKSMCDRIAETFGINMTYNQMKSYFSNHRLHAAPRKGRKGISKYPDGMEEYIKLIAAKKSTEELTNAVNEKYGPGTITVSHMRAYKKNHGITTGLTGRFEKGHVSFNKGKKQSEYMSAEAIAKTVPTRFKTGHVPHNGRVPVGEIRLRKSSQKRPNAKSYYWQKVEQPNKWRLYHVIIWENHNGPVPDGCMVTFADGDTMNCDIDNLILETKAQHAIKNRHLGVKSYDKKSAEALNTMADLRMLITQKRKKMKK